MALLPSDKAAVEKLAEPSPAKLTGAPIADPFALNWTFPVAETPPVTVALNVRLSPTVEGFVPLVSVTVVEVEAGVMVAVVVAVVLESTYLEAAAPVRLRLVTVTVLSFPAFAFANVPVPPVRDTSSEPTTPVSVRVRMEAVTFPSYVLFDAVTAGVRILFCAVVVSVTSVALA